MGYPRKITPAPILSPIEQSIKRKIEAVGTPLKDWDINIYRGVLTGCNEAFIINYEKRDEILAKCQTTEDDKERLNLYDPFLSAKTISEKTSEKFTVSDRTIENALAQLKKKGIIAREGGRKEGKWVIINKE